MIKCVGCPYPFNNIWIKHPSLLDSAQLCISFDFKIDVLTFSYLQGWPKLSTISNMCRSRPLFCLFSSLSHSNINTNSRKCRWYGWDSNLLPQVGGRRRNHRAMATWNKNYFVWYLAMQLNDLFRINFRCLLEFNDLLTQTEHNPTISRLLQGLRGKQGHFQGRFEPKKSVLRF